ncbi:MAG TPA: amidase family protein [Pseudomonadota bacterium]|nr:amidase family protein [Pseudomonadota bacterium]
MLSPSVVLRSRGRLITRTLPASALTLATALGAGCGPGPELDLSFNPQEATIEQLRGYVKTNIVSCRSLIGRYQLLHDSLDPTFRTVVLWNTQVFQDADRLDRTPVGQRGSLHCVPIVVKDNLNYAGLPTTGGARALSTAITGNNAEAVQRLLTAGAIVLGKTNMPDFALDGINTLSSQGGQTVNPYNRALTVYGSSGGSAAAVSASLGIIGLGTDTFGSLILPANATGLVTIRPTQGLVPATGVLPLMSLQDAVGPMTRTVEDAAAALELLVDKKFVGSGSQNYTAMLSRDGLRGVSLGYDPLLLQTLPAPPLVPSQEVADLFNQTLGNLGKAGASAKPVDALMTLFPTLQAATDLSFKCMPVDFKQSLNGYLSSSRPEVTTRTLADIIATGQFLDSVKMFLNNAQAQTDTIATSADCQQYLTAKAAANSAIVALMDKQGVDLLVYPAANQPAFPIGPPPAGWYGFQALSSVTGLPSLTMPMGIAAKAGAPVGLVFLARNHQEAKLIQAAYSFQAQFKPRTAPSL